MLNYTLDLTRDWSPVDIALIQPVEGGIRSRATPSPCHQAERDTRGCHETPHSAPPCLGVPAAPGSVRLTPTVVQESVEHQD